MGLTERVRYLRKMSSRGAEGQAVVAGREGYGVWPSNIEQLGSLSPLASTWVERVKGIIDPRQGVSLIDVGCGNATRSYPIAEAFTATGYPVTMRLVDTQADALISAQHTLSQVSIPANLRFISD